MISTNTKSKEIIKKVESFCIENEIFKMNDKLVIACSGGPDSMALVDILLKLSPKYHLKINVAHAEHGIREITSLEDAKYVENYCKEKNIPFFLGHLAVLEKQIEKKTSVETLARVLRYEFLRKVAKKINTNKILTAHHLNDQAETILQHFIRGAGADGLSGMKIINNDIYRPFLCLYRDEIELYCKENMLNPRTDETNNSLIYERNRIRLDLIPKMQEYNPKVVTAICNNAKIIAREHSFIEFYVKNFYEKNCIYLDNKISIKKSLLLKEHEAIRLAVYRYIISKLQNNLENISFVHIDKIDKFLYNGHTGAILQLPKELRIKISYEDLVFYKQDSKEQFKENNIHYEILAKFNQENILPTGQSIYIEKIEQIDNMNLKESIKGRDCCIIDAEKVVGKITIRNRKNGDRIIPKGMQGNKKLKDIFIDKKIPVELRDKIPLVCDEQGIIWIAGIQQSDFYIVNKYSKHIIYLNLKKIN